ncbi:cell division septation protein DedD [Ereboglobus sp. PH5-10]|uniref:hypothetical protein n=1 Tax=Ereboglobus sp. PH5-10 TaxID=2940629 RepID=UPI00240678B9|nr:hypothetical protein [Ereboglobus sp. PH5-10]MDF9827929.1 cell division septation protein DedD [Ereboglobus sp. PH5-10]
MKPTKKLARIIQNCLRDTGQKNTAINHAKLEIYLLEELDVQKFLDGKTKAEIVAVCDAKPEPAQPPPGKEKREFSIILRCSRSDVEKLTAIKRTSRVTTNSAAIRVAIDKAASVKPRLDLPHAYSVEEVRDIVGTIDRFARELAIAVRHWLVHQDDDTPKMREITNTCRDQCIRILDEVEKPLNKGKLILHGIMASKQFSISSLKEAQHILQKLGDISAKQSVHPGNKPNIQSAWKTRTTYLGLVMDFFATIGIRPYPSADNTVTSNPVTQTPASKTTATATPCASAPVPIPPKIAPAPQPPPPQSPKPPPVGEPPRAP